MAVDWLKRWRDDTTAASVPFVTWLDKQKMSPVDRALAKEAARGATASSESLAHAEGIIAGFGLEKPGIQLADRPISDELVKLADHWQYAADPVKAETVSRLKAYATGLTDKERRATFRATLQDLKAKDKALTKLADPLLAVLKQLLAGSAPWSCRVTTSTSRLAGG
jgi:hypothetical protein